MKKFLLVIFVLAGYVFNVTGQTVVFTNDLETWTGNVPTGFVGAKTSLEADSIQHYTLAAHGGTSSVQLINTEATHKRFTTQPISVVNAEVYTISFWVKGHGNVRTNIFDGRATGSGYGTYNPYITINSSTWTQQNQTVTCANTLPNGEFILSVQSTFADLGHLQIDDVTITSGSTLPPTLTITSPTNAGTVFSPNVSVVFNVANFVVGNPGTGIDGHIHYTVDGGTAVMYYSTAPIAVTGLAAGSHTIVLSLVDNTHQPISPAVSASVTFDVDLTPPPITTVYQIQYTTEVSGNSSFMDSTVNTAGIVTASNASGYFIQSGTGPWSGIYVYDNLHPTLIGDSVILTGLVKEYYNLTELSGITNFSVISSGNTLPAISIIDCHSVNTEQYEGVLVKVLNAQCVSTSAGIGMWKIEDLSDTCKVHNLFFTYTPVLNTYYDVTGPIYYTFNQPRIEPRFAADVQAVTGIPTIGSTFLPYAFPNPANSLVNLENLKGIQEIQVISIDGKLVKIIPCLGQESFQSDFSSLQTGAYFIRFVDINGNVQMQRIVKE
jgi:hypothetical protein